MKASVAALVCLAAAQAAFAAPTFQRRDLGGESSLLIARQAQDVPQGPSASNYAGTSEGASARTSSTGHASRPHHRGSKHPHHKVHRKGKGKGKKHPHHAHGKHTGLQRHHRPAPLKIQSSGALQSAQPLSPGLASSQSAQPLTPQSAAVTEPGSAPSTAGSLAPSTPGSAAPSTGNSQYASPISPRSADLFSGSDEGSIFAKRQEAPASPSPDSAAVMQPQTAASVSGPQTPGGGARPHPHKHRHHRHRHGRHRHGRHRHGRHRHGRHRHHRHGHGRKHRHHRHKHHRKAAAGGAPASPAPVSAPSSPAPAA